MWESRNREISSKAIYLQNLSEKVISLNDRLIEDNKNLVKKHRLLIDYVEENLKKK